MIIRAMCSDPLRHYSRSIERTFPQADRERGQTVFYSDYQLGKDRMEQVRAEVQWNRLEVSLARGFRLQKADDARRSGLARGTALIGTLIR
jgi:hypothetical protein